MLELVSGPEFLLDRLSWAPGNNWQHAYSGCWFDADGDLSFAIAVSPRLELIALALIVASIGNPIYAVANQTALVEAADASNRGSVMATRFGLVQTAIIIGTAAGGLITRNMGRSPPTRFSA